MLAPLTLLVLAATPAPCAPTQARADAVEGAPTFRIVAEPVLSKEARQGQLQCKTIFALGDLDCDEVEDVALALISKNGVELVAVSSARLDALWRIEVVGAGARARVDACAVRDLDGDGVADALIGVVPLDGAVRSGSKEGFARCVSGVDGAILAEARSPLGSARNDEFGWSVAPAYDFDHDGLAELAVGAPGVGAVHLYSYSGVLAGGWLRRVAAIDGADFVAQPEGFGQVLARVDTRFEDAGLVIGAGGWPFLRREDVETVLVHGNPPTRLLCLAGPAASLKPTFVLALGDVEGDGSPDLLAAEADRGARMLCGRTGAELVSFHGPTNEISGEGFTCARVGDADGDGARDFATGAKDDFGGMIDEQGFVTLYSGRDGALLHRVWFRHDGADLAATGDLDGDLLPEVLVHLPCSGVLQALSGRDLAELRSVDVRTLRR